MNIAQKAGQLYEKMEYISENEAEKRNLRADIYIIKPRHQHDEDISNLAREAHGDLFPNDYTYRFIADALSTLHDSDVETIDEAQEAIAQIEPDPYTSDLTAWLASDVRRVYYLDDIIGEYSPDDGFTLLAMAQQQERQEVANSVLHSILKLIEEEGGE